MEINPKRGTVTERVFRKKIQSVALHQLYRALDFFPEMTLGDGPKNPLISVNRGIFGTITERVF